MSSSLIKRTKPLSNLRRKSRFRLFNSVARTSLVELSFRSIPAMLIGIQS